MGKVTVPARVENLEDLFALEKGTLTSDQVRRVEVTEALVDTGASMLGLPKQLLDQLGLRLYRTRQARTAGGTGTMNIYQAARLTVLGRDCNCDVMELADDMPVLIGQVPLELLDFVVNPVGQKLIGNPDHGGEQMIDVF